MPTLPPRPCTYPRCKKMQKKRSRCEDHQVSHAWKGSNKFSNGWKWSRLKNNALQRDNFLCVKCIEKGEPRRAEEVDHIIPRSRGGSDDQSNLMSLCSRCHSIKTKSESNFAKKNIRKPACRVVMVYGPPGSGKSRYCKEAKGSHDVVIDFDDIVEEISGQSRAEQTNTEAFVIRANRLRNIRIDELHNTGYKTAWVPMTLPKKADRDWWEKQIGAEFILMETELFTCLSRIDGDDSRSKAEKEKTKEAVYKWYSEWSR